MLLSFRSEARALAEFGNGWETELENKADIETSLFAKGVSEVGTVDDGQTRISLGQNTNTAWRDGFISLFSFSTKDYWCCQ